MTLSASDDLIGELDRRSKMEECLFKHLPNHRRKDVDLPNMYKIAKDMDLTRQGVSQWFARGNITVDNFEKLMSLEGSTLTIELLYPFALKQ